MSKLRSILFTVCASILCIAVYGQSGTVASGGSAKNTSGSISYSVGQVGDAYTIDADGTVSEGVQQPYEIFIITSEDRPVGQHIRLFPNPTIGEIRVLLDAEVHGPIDYVLIGQNGSILSSGKLQDAQMMIPMHDYPAGTYLISLSAEGQPKTTFKVVKIQ